MNFDDQKTQILDLLVQESTLSLGFAHSDLEAFINESTVLKVSAGKEFIWCS